MLIARMSNGAVVYGLSRENIKRLQAGQQIRITPETHKGAPMPEGAPAMYIMYGEDEADCLKQLKAAGVDMKDAMAHAHEIPK